MSVVENIINTNTFVPYVPYVPYKLDWYYTIQRKQLRIRNKINRRRHRAANIIQKGCKNWLQEIVTKDGKYGIWFRIEMNKLQSVGMFTNKKMIKNELL